MSDKPQIPQNEVHKAQALARHHVGQEARAKGYDPATLRALATYGKETVIGEGAEALTLLPQTLQVQLCLIEHGKIFQAGEGMTVADGVERLTHLALIYSDPDLAFELLTDSELTPDQIRKEFKLTCFRLSKHFKDSECIEKLSAHIMAQMQLTDEASGETGKKSPAPPKVLGGSRKSRR